MVLVVENGKLTHDMGAKTAALMITSNYHVTGFLNFYGQASIITCHVPMLVANVGLNV
jgi:hypothetical protein